jgi:hypothetical protein
MPRLLLDIDDVLKARSEGLLPHAEARTSV